VGLFLALVFGLAAGLWYNLAALRALEREAARPRDPATGIIPGTEAATLAGEGPGGALLVHGFLGSRGDFNRLGEALRGAGFSVRLMRLPGHGTGPLDMAVMSPERLTAAVREEWREVRRRFRPAVLVGFSMGGALAVLAAAEEPPDALVLVAPYFGITYWWPLVLPVETWNSLLGPLVPMAVKDQRFMQVNVPEARSRIFSYGVVPVRAVEVLIDLGRQARRPGVLESIRSPVLVLHSVGDRAASPSACRRAFERIGSPKKRCVWYERSNHILMWDHDAEAATGEILGFLGAIGG